MFHVFLTRECPLTTEVNFTKANKDKSPEKSLKSVLRICILNNLILIAVGTNTCSCINHDPAILKTAHK